MVEIEFSNGLLEKYKGVNPFPNTFSEFVYLRTYSRWLEDKGRRETWLETCIRCVKYSYKLYTGPTKLDKLQVEANQSLDDMFYLRQLPSGRTMWVGGTPIIDEIPTANYNCSFEVIDSLESFKDLFYLLMVGCGVGFSTEEKYVKKLPLFNKTVELTIKEYNWNRSYKENTEILETKPGRFTLLIGDSREGWSDGLLKFLEVLSNPKAKHLEVNLDDVRPQGERLTKFGGKASGPEPYIQMLKMIHQIISEADEVPITEEFSGDCNLKPGIPSPDQPNLKVLGWSGLVELRPIDVLDICNIIGQNVVAGGVRRTAEIALFDADDDQMLHAKDQFWASPRTQHRSMSNNSVMFWNKPKFSYLTNLKESIKNSYEPGFVNAQAASKRRTNFAGMNPCVEILLPNKGFCNLSTVFVTACIETRNGVDYINFDKLTRLIRQATRHCMRITNVDIELPEWDAVQKRDRLLGVNITGTEDAFDAAFTGETLDKYVKGVDIQGNLTYEYPDDGRKVRIIHNGVEQEVIVDDFKGLLNEEANDEADTYSIEMGIPRPLLVTTVQPSGTLSQLVACSSGFHRSFAPYYIRRVRINSFDALAQTVKQQGYKIYPEFGKGWSKLPEEYHAYVERVTGKKDLHTMTSKDFDLVDDYVKDLVLSLADTWVVEFVVKTHATSSAADESAISQLKRYFSYQNNWTDHNTSATIQVADDEWDELFELLYKRWDEYIGVSFQNKSNDKYDLAPYEAINETEYNARIALQKPIDIDLLNKIENGNNSADDDLDTGCATGQCPVR